MGWRVRAVIAANQSRRTVPKHERRIFVESFAKDPDNALTVRVEKGHAASRTKGRDPLASRLLPDVLVLPAPVDFEAVSLMRYLERAALLAQLIPLPVGTRRGLATKPRADARAYLKVMCRCAIHHWCFALSATQADRCCRRSSDSTSGCDVKCVSSRSFCAPVRGEV